MGHTKGLKQQQQQPGQAPPRATADFEGYLARSENCEAELEAIIEGLQVASSLRSPRRCLACALFKHRIQPELPLPPHPYSSVA